MSEPSPPPVLLMKLQRPLPGTFHVQRSRLLVLLEASPTSPIVLMCAPAGYGKTTALVELSDTWEQRGGSIAWLSLDARDNDAGRLAAHLWAAFELPRLGMRASRRSLETVMITIVNRLVKSRRPYLLVLDDYHLITSPEVHAGVTLLIENIPPTAKIMIGTRSDPPLQLSRLRVRGKLVEVRAAELRFTHPEMRSFCQTALRVTPSNHTLELLESVTEGWAAGLHLTALHLQRASPSLDDATIAAFAGQVSGDATLVFDYLAEEVLSQQTAEHEHFLLATSVLTRFTADLCRAITRDAAAAEHLRELQHAGLFLTALEEERGWYRYHYLFGEFLRARLQETAPDQVSALHRRAAEWYTRHGDTDEAMRHAAAARRGSVHSHGEHNERQEEVDALTTRELEIVRLMADGATNQEIADCLVISLGTVKSHVNHIMSKLDAHNRTEAVSLARHKSLLNY